MTANIINALANAETRRYNLAVEKLRSAELQENVRHNQAVESENIRHNQTVERETQRANMRNEGLKAESNLIDLRNAYSNRMNAESNAQNAATNRGNLSINAVNAKTSRFSAAATALNNSLGTLISAYNTNVRKEELQESQRHNKAVEAETYRNNVVINDIKQQEATTAKKRAETEKWKAERQYEIDSAYVQQGWARNIGDLVINGARVTATAQ